MDLNVLATVSDQGFNFLRFHESLGACVDGPSFEMHGKRNFTHGKRNFTIFDPSHPLKYIRNNHLQYNFQFEEKTDISAFFIKSRN